MFINEGVRQNNIDMIKTALRNGDIMVNNVNHIELTTLGMAITYGCSIELINLLLSEGAEIKTEYRINHSPLTIHEYNHLHLAIIYRRADIVQTFLERGTKIVKDIPFFKIIEGLNKVTKLYGVCSFFEDDKANTVYAETELCSHGILTTLNIAFGVRDPKIIQLILQHDKNSFIGHIQDDGTIPHPEYLNQVGLRKVGEYYTYHPYHKNCSDDSNKSLSYTDFIRYIDNLNNVDIDYLNHHIAGTTDRIADERIGLLKRYIDTHSRIAYMIILCCSQGNNITDQDKIGMLKLIAKCVNQLELNNMISSINTLLEDNIVSKLPHSVQHSDIINKISLYLNCIETMSNSNKIFKHAVKEIEKAINTILVGSEGQSVSVQAGIHISKLQIQ